MTNEDLKPCPFCGAEPLMQEHEPHTHSVGLGLPDHPGSFTIECPTDGCCGLIADAKTEAIAAWNRRAAPSVASSAPADELPPLPEPLEIYWPELHSQALGCGVEDRNIHDRYEAAEYGWRDGVDKAIERVPESIYDADQMCAYARAAVLAERAACADIVDNADSPDCGGWNMNHIAERIRARN